MNGMLTRISTDANGNLVLKIVLSSEVAPRDIFTKVNELVDLRFDVDGAQEEE